MSETLQFEPIGYLKSCFKEKFGTPRQPHLVPGSTAFLQIHGDLNPAEALQGLEEFSHVWIIFHFHKNANKQFNAKIYPPRMDGEKIGVFATRSPHRANSIGLSCAKIERIEKDTLYLSGIDMIDGTPVLDIKPYIPEVDAIAEAKVGWVGRAASQALDVEFSSDAERDLTSIPSTEFKKMVTQILAQDPRNPMDREPSRENKSLGFFLGDYNVIFAVENRKARVLRIESRHDFDQRNSPT